jgi:hypothetical protein
LLGYAPLAQAVRDAGVELMQLDRDSGASAYGAGSTSPNGAGP